MYVEKLFEVQWPLLEDNVDILHNIDNILQ